MKHPQFIIATASKLFENYPRWCNSLLQRSMVDFLAEAQEHLTIRQRAHLETNNNYRQLLPYVILRYKDATGTYRYFTYKRKDGVGEQKLVGKYSLGFGGHVDLPDVCVGEDGIPNLADTLNLSTGREIVEELVYVKEDGTDGEEYDLNEQLLSRTTGLFVKADTDPEDKHLGIIIVIDVKPETILRCREEELEMVGGMTVAELLESDFEIEAWSKLFLDYIAHLEDSLHSDTPLAMTTLDSELLFGKAYHYFNTDTLVHGWPVYEGDHSEIGPDDDVVADFDPEADVELDPVSIRDQAVDIDVKESYSGSPFGALTESDFDTTSEEFKSLCDRSFRNMEGVIANVGRLTVLAGYSDLMVNRGIPKKRLVIVDITNNVQADAPAIMEQVAALATLFYTQYRDGSPRDIQGLMTFFSNPKVVDIVQGYEYVASIPGLGIIATSDNAAMMYNAKMTESGMELRSFVPVIMMTEQGHINGKIYVTADVNDRRGTPVKTEA
jgi:predicted NUDIX family phosphoesterase